MQVITTHVNADFDALGAVVAATHLYPKSIGILPENIEENVNRFLNQYGDNWPIKYGKVKWPAEVELAVIVDTSMTGMLGPFAHNLLQCKRVHLYDHRPSSCNIIADQKHVEQVGAVTTILLEKIREQNISLNSLEVALMGLAIYEDTGLLTFSSTTPRDLEALSYLYKLGFKTEFIQKFLTNILPGKYMSMLNNFLSIAEHREICGYKIITVMASFSEYVFGVLELTEQVRVTKNADMAFTFTDICGSIYITGQGSTEKIIASDLVKEFMDNNIEVDIKTNSISISRQKFLIFLEKRIKSSLAASCSNALDLPNDLKQLINQRLPKRLQALFWLMGQEAEKEGFKVYLAGKFIRNLILGYPCAEVELVISDDAISFARKVNKYLKGKILELNHTGVAYIKGKEISIHLTTAHRELNPFAPAEEAKISGLRRALYNQDFTIDTLACSLNPFYFGYVYDFYKGKEDIQKKKIRVLYNLSFTEDPLRIIRAVNLEQQLGFHIEEETLDLLKRGVNNRLLDKVSRDRISQEIISILNKPDPLKVLCRLNDLNIFPRLFPHIKPGRIWKRLAAIRTIILSKKYPGNGPLNYTLLHLCALFYDLSEKQIHYHCWRLHFEIRTRKEIINIIKQCQVITNKLKDLNETGNMLRSLSRESLILLRALKQLQAKEEYFAESN